MITRFAVLLLMCVLAANARADGCDLKNIKFGSSQEQLKNNFNINAPDSETTGEAVITTGATSLCSSLPEAALVEFTLIDDSLVQARLINENTASELYNFARDVFGEPENKTDPKKIKPGDKPRRGLWGKDTGYSVMYTTYKAGRRSYENLIVVSTKHKKLFDKANKIKADASDDRLKQMHGGIYKNNFSGDGN